MLEAIFATGVFWGAFHFSLGPWWLAFMEAARNTPPKTLGRNFGIYCLVGWIPFVILSSMLLQAIGGLHKFVLIGLHFGGALMMLHLAHKTLKAATGRATSLNFDWRMMTLVVWTSPKAWLTIPAGSLAANYTDSPAANVVFFCLFSFPFYLISMPLWFALGRKGAKLTSGKLSYFNAFLLTCFAAYLAWHGGKIAVTG